MQPEERKDAYLPIIFHLSRKEDRKKMEAVLRLPGITVIDEIEEQQKELALVKNPRLLHGGSAKRKKSKPKTCWVYFPWRHTIVHILDEKEYARLRTSRNQDLITLKEQEHIARARIGIAGLNVGNPAAICMALTGMGSALKFADNDILSVSNLNRFRAGLPDLGVNKAVLSARQAYEINPFLSLDVFPKGIMPDTIDAFLLHPRIDVLVEETDNLALKVLIRKRAQELKIPVVMVTGNGPNVIVDVERFDTKQRGPLLNGYLPKRVEEAIIRGMQSGFLFKEKIRLARDFMGASFLHPRLRASFLKVGETLAGIPQLAESSFLRGAVVAHVVRQIITKQPMPSGRYAVRLDTVHRARI
jgi:hypothetical protein